MTLGNMRNVATIGKPIANVLNRVGKHEIENLDLPH